MTRPPGGRSGRDLLGGVTVPLVTPMSAPGVPSAAAAERLLAALAAAGARGLMLFGSNGEGALLPVGALGAFAAGVTRRWRELTGDGPVLVNVTGPGTAEALARADAVRAAEPDAVVLSPPFYYRHREDEILAHYAAFAGLGLPVIAYHVPRYSNPIGAGLLATIAALPHVVGLKDSSGDLGLLGAAVEAAGREEGFGVSQGAESLLLAGLARGADGIVPGVANLAPGLCARLYAAHRAGRRAEAEQAQRAVGELLRLHQVRPGVPAVKAILDSRGLCPPHVAAPFSPVTEAERGQLLSLLAPSERHLIRA
ncbi:dihydrodipicolinate synthase family protein [Streptomyces hoynatensis]|uniref:Dihydrodipicolinate synthase family protein n=1 Tax=Streptomyces hoynatensis TaxID=1141874 RepID=A0A3A9YZM7_9ACTN|nr:dihydrodipicolinate synthase family protein [Streptomyces hoynatensis]RKN41199.1 dihydrodipicolinate synthase family protein [Streptomyces hoynatensis]